MWPNYGYDLSAGDKEIPVGFKEELTDVTSH